MRTILRSHFFWLGTLVRLPLLFVSSSHYLNELFIPFLDAAIAQPLVNPWDLSHPSFFPYGSALFFPLFLPKLLLSFLFGDQALGLSSLSIFSVKAVLMIADIALLWFLTKLAAARTRELIFFYWLNPVLIYISYVHGQLDLIPTLFSFGAIYLMIKERWDWSAVIAALAVLSKFHTIILVPLMMAFIWNTHFWKPAAIKLLRFSGLFLVTLLLGYLPFRSSTSDCYTTVCSPEALRVFGATIDLGNSNVIYIGIAIFVGVLFRLCLSTRLTKESLLYGSGFLYGILILVVDPMPGWYYWVFPFLALFYANYALAFRTLFYLSCLLYLLYFNPIHSFPEHLHGYVYGTLLTLLQLSLFGILMTMWTFVIKRNSPWARRIRPLVMGIAGNSGAGKNTLSSALADLFGRSMTVIEGDDYHKWERGHGRWLDYTHLSPRANNLEQLVEHTSQLTSGGLIYHPHYDHSVGRFTAPRLIKSTKTLLIQGLHILYQRDIRKHLDVSIFLAPDERLRLAWKIERDVKKRGHSLEQVQKSLLAREKDSQLHIEPQRLKADLVIEYIPSEDFDPVKDPLPHCFVRYTFWNDVALDSLIAELAKKSKVSIQFIPSDLDRVCLQIDGELTVSDLAEIARQCLIPLRHLTRSWQEPIWQTGVQGLNQLMTLVMLQRQVILGK